MIDALRKEREQLLNRLAEIQAELNRLAPVERPKPEIGQVWRELGGKKHVIRGPQKLGYVKANLENFVFVCAVPHADGDFSYLCGQDHCRCTQ